MKRFFDEVDAQASPIGYLPNPDDINFGGTDVSPETLRELLSVDQELWKQEAAGIEEFYQKFGSKLPAALKEELETLKHNLQ